MTLFSATIILFLIMDPLGNIASFLRVLEHIEPKRRLWVIFREMAIALSAMLLFCLIGNTLLDHLQVSQSAVYFTSAIILFLVAIQILFPTLRSLRAPNKELTGDPLVVPLAIPLIAGPSLLATIMLYSHLDGFKTSLYIAILIAWVLSLAVLISSQWIYRLLGKSGLIALERLMGMILVLLSIQRFLEGIIEFTLKN